MELQIIKGRSRGGIIFLVVVGVVTAVIFGWVRGAKDGASARSDGKITPPLTKGDGKIERQAAECLKKFRSANNWLTKRALVRHPNTAGPKMLEYYISRHLTDPGANGLHFQSIRRNGSWEVVHFGFPNPHPSPLGEATIVRENDGSLLLDWESYVGFGDLGWEDFMVKRPALPILMRVMISPSRYYNYEFENNMRYEAYRLDSPDGKHLLNAYCERSSGVFIKLTDLMFHHNGEKTPATVKVSFPEHAKSNNCVKLDALVAEGWLVLE